MRAKENHRERRTPHDKPQRLHAIHARHFKIESDHIRPQFLDFLQREGAVHRRAHDLDQGVPGENRRNQLPHESGIIDNEDADAVCHAMAPNGIARDKRASTAGTLRMSTTVPSPGMDAPLTRSLATMSGGSALITSSSSPTMLSTSKPNRFSAAPMTITKLRFFCGFESIARSFPR